MLKWLKMLIFVCLSHPIDQHFRMPYVVGCSLYGMNVMCFIYRKTFIFKETNENIGLIKYFCSFRCWPGVEVLPGRCSLESSSLKY